MKIENYREQPSGSYAIAIFDVYLEKMQLGLRNLKLCVAKKSGIHFIGYPSYGEDKGDGSKEWHPYFIFSGEKKKEFEESVFEELKNFVRGPLVRGRSS